MDDPVRLPLAVRAFNAGTAPFARWLFPLDPERLIAEARRKGGGTDFGDDGFRQGLGHLCASLEEEAGLTPLGRTIARRDILRCLVNRTLMQSWRQRHPEIAKQAIERPLFVVGMGRTGTTILHDLLAQDPANRVPYSWEVAVPCPPPERAHAHDDPRIAALDAELAGVDRLMPEFKKMHPMGARLPQECVGITAHEFASMIYQISYDLPSYSAWLQCEADLRPVYAAHRRFLQLLQWRWPAERWVLKSPGHLWALERVLAEYPDARLVQTHRDPLRVIASLASLTETLRGLTAWRVDRRAIAREWLEEIATALDRSVDARQRGVVPPGRIVDFHFRELLQDPFAGIRRIYEHFEIEFTPEAEEGMRRHLVENPSDKHGAHRYRFADTGIDIGEARERFRRYVEYFDVPAESLEQ
ncbi:MAG TPA: sulfotransferase [Myxococcota bacterium]|nr:sulfotransferase [Myxococcota bacterium]